MISHSAHARGSVYREVQDFQHGSCYGIVLGGTLLQLYHCITFVVPLFHTEGDKSSVSTGVLKSNQV